MSTVAQTLLAIVLLAAVALKLRDRARSADALATYGIEPAAARVTALVLIAAAELVIAGGLIAGVRWAAVAACVLFAAFAIASSGALLAGRAGRPCACFGARSRLSRFSPLQGLLAGALAFALARHWLAGAPSGYQRWLGVGLTLSLTAIVALAAVVLALAREVGVLRLSMASQGALEIPDEGPRVGGLAIFSSEGCPMCRRLEPAVNYVAADPLLAVRIFDEVADAPAWASAAIPGSPYAVALDSAGVALAKGTFNSLVQLESIIATARAREAGLAVVV